MTEHTPEPWGNRKNGTSTSDIFDVKRGEDIGYIFSEIDARRISLCVNACADIPNDDLAMIGDHILNTRVDEFAYVRSLEIQRDELLALVKNVRSDIILSTQNSDLSLVLTMLSEAIAKAEQ